MIRKTGIKILVRQAGIGYTATPISKYWRRRFAEHMREWKYCQVGMHYSFDNSRYTESELCQVYYQGLWDLPEAIVLNRQYAELVKGWNITLLIDPWEFGHWLGYDAHTIAEGS